MIKIDNINIIHFIMMERMEAALARRETVVEILACPFSSLRLLEEKTREPISGEKTRAQHSQPGTAQQARSSLLRSDHQRQTPPGRHLPLEEEAAEEGTEAAAEGDEAETEPAPHPVWELF